MKSSAPKIQESSQERSLRQQGSQLSSAAIQLKGPNAARASKVAAADNTAIMSTAAAGATAKTLRDRLSKVTTGTQRVEAILGGNTAAIGTQMKAQATGGAERINSMAANVKRGLGVTGTVLNSLTQQANAAQQASEIEVQSKMQAQANKMAAIGNVIGSAAEYGSYKAAQAENQKVLDALNGIPTTTGNPVLDNSPVISRWTFPGG